MQLSPPHGAPAFRRPATRPRGAPWLAAVFWLVLAGLLAALGMKALEACGIGRDGGRPMLSYCPPPAAPDPRLARLNGEREREAALRERLSRMQLALAEAPPCPMPEPPVQVAETPPPEPPPPEPVAEIPPAPPIQPPAPRQRPTPPPAPPQDIPEQRWNQRDISLLEGCWTLISDYRLQVVGTGRIIGVRSWRMCFRPNGRGSQELVFDDGTTCRGNVAARFGPDGRLIIDDQSFVPCSRRMRILRRTTSCERVADGTARCRAFDTADPRRGSNVVFRR